MSLWDATAISVGAVIGAGIYVVVGVAAGYAGSALAVSTALAAVVSVFTALSFCELAAWQPLEGSIYEYVYRLISPFAGFLTGWMWIVSNTFAGAAVALGFASYLHALFPAFSPSWAAAMLCLFFTVLNFVGIRQSALLNNILVVAKLGILGFFVVYGALYTNPLNFAGFNPFQLGALYAAFYIFFAYGGFARVAVVAEEVKDARRNVPRAILLSLLISTAVYVSVGVVAVGLVGAQRLAESSSPLTGAIKATGNVAAAHLVSAGGLIATASVLLTAILGVSRMMYAMARRGDLPKKLGRLHPAFNTPHYAVWITGAAMTGLALFVDLTGVVAVSTFALLFYYTLANVAALKIKNHKRRYPKAVSILGTATCLTFLATTLPTKPEAWTIGIATIIVGVVYYVVEMKLS
ncbi:MAG: amino acid permease [Candidatus Bathyarchaeota archaeon]|nr:amino acid permease [Candidatus Bathyarchaeota archaeon]